jgi:hypothetical protein
MGPLSDLKFQTALPTKQPKEKNPSVILFLLQQHNKSLVKL